MPIHVHGLKQANHHCDRDTTRSSPALTSAVRTHASITKWYKHRNLHRSKLRHQGGNMSADEDGSDSHVALSRVGSHRRLVINSWVWFDNKALGVFCCFDTMKCLVSSFADLNHVTSKKFGLRSYFDPHADGNRALHKVNICAHFWLWLFIYDLIGLFFQVISLFSQGTWHHNYWWRGLISFLRKDFAVSKTQRDRTTADGWLVISWLLDCCFLSVSY